MVRRRLVPVWTNGDSVSKDSSQEWELLSAPSLKQLQRAGLLGAQGLQLVRKEHLG